MTHRSHLDHRLPSSLSFSTGVFRGLFFLLRPGSSRQGRRCSLLPQIFVSRNAMYSGGKATGGCSGISTKHIRRNAMLQTHLRTASKPSPLPPTKSWMYGCPHIRSPPPAWETKILSGLDAVAVVFSCIVDAEEIRHKSSVRSSLFQISTYHQPCKVGGLCGFSTTWKS